MNDLLPEELEKLQTTLVDQLEASECMPLDGAHGFLTAVAAHEHIISRELACAHVLGKIPEELGLLPLMQKFQHHLINDLETGKYGPLIMQMPRTDNTSLPIPYSWCEGYAQGMNSLGDSLQEEMLKHEDVMVMLTPIFGLMMTDEDHMFNPPNEDAHREAVEQLGVSAVSIYNWWLHQRTGSLQ